MQRCIVVITLCATLFVLPACSNPLSAVVETNLEISAADYVFTPAQITIPAGQEVTLTLINEGAVEHEWVLVKEGAEINEPFDEAQEKEKIFWDIEAEPGTTSTGSFIAPANPGMYQVVCAIPGHIELGMVGSVTVE